MTNEYQRLHWVDLVTLRTTGNEFTVKKVCLAGKIMNVELHVNI